MLMLMPIGGFAFTKGMPKPFTRNDLEGAVTREFCAECGTHLITRRPGLSAIILKVGTLDDPALYGSPQMAIYIPSRKGCRVLSGCRKGRTRETFSSSLRKQGPINHRPGLLHEAGAAGCGNNIISGWVPACAGTT